MSNNVIEISNLSKQYRLGQVGSTTLSDDLKRWWYRVRGKEDPFLKVGEENDRTQKGDSEYVWALKDINFNVEKGDVLGIIGKNGAGKSTLLKILSRTTTPTIGEYRIKGRVASLLEVGTGFHPDLTGRENVYLNGAILGMTKSEIKRNFDEIVNFSGVERYIDTPVKRYSSGMYVRLAFAVAAHLEPEILIVDEVLAVGDAEFRKKCLGKMSEVSKVGKTVLFVSHELSAISAICNKGMLLKNGTLRDIGNINQTIATYLNEVINLKAKLIWEDNKPGDEVVKLNSITLINDKHIETFQHYYSKKIGVKINYEIIIPNTLVNICVAIYTVTEVLVFMTFPKKSQVINEKGIHEITCWIPAKLLNTEMYLLRINAHSFYPTQLHFDLSSVLQFEVKEDDQKTYEICYEDKISGTVQVECNWE